MIDIKIQTDAFIDEVTPHPNDDKPFGIKTGKDVATWIDHEEIFCFDIDVEPLLTVVTNKILEQALLELTEEQEIKNIREAKLKFSKRNADEKAKIKKIELEEINRRKDIETIKKQNKLDKEKKVAVQQKIFSRITSKKYLSELCNNTLNLLSENNYFNNYKVIYLKEITFKEINHTSKVLSTKDEELLQTSTSLIQDSILNKLIGHKIFMQERREKQRQDLLGLIEKQRLLEEQKENERIAREKRKNQEKIEKLKKHIKENVIKKAEIKDDYYKEDMVGVSGWDGYLKEDDAKDKDSCNLFGGMITHFLLALTILKTDVFSINESYFTQDIINEVIKTYCQEAKIHVSLASNNEEEIKNILKNNREAQDEDLENFSLNKLNDLSASREEWFKISEILSKIENQNDQYLKFCFQSLEEQENIFLSKMNDKTLKKKEKDSLINPNPIPINEFKHCYEILIKAIVAQVEHGANGINLAFNKKEAQEKLFKSQFTTKKAYCCIVPHDELPAYLEAATWERHAIVKKLKLPKIPDDFSKAKIYPSTIQVIDPNTGHNFGNYSVLFEDTYAEFFCTLKFIEIFLRVIVSKFDLDNLDSKIIHMRFYEVYLRVFKYFKDVFNIQSKIQYFEFDYFEEDVVETLVENN